MLVAEADGGSSDCPVLTQDRRGALLGGALTVLATGASLVPFMRGGVAEIAHWQDWPAKLELVSTVQTMVAGDARIAGAGARLAALAALAIGAALAPLDRRAWPALLVHYLQAGLALLTVFVLLPLAGRPVPAQDERQFLMLLPSALLCFSVGVRWLSRRTYGWLPAAALCLALCITDDDTRFVTNKRCLHSIPVLSMRQLLENIDGPN